MPTTLALVDVAGSGTDDDPRRPDFPDGVEPDAWYAPADRMSENAPLRLVSVRASQSDIDAIEAAARTVYPTAQAASARIDAIYPGLSADRYRDKYTVE